MAQTYIKMGTQYIQPLIDLEAQKYADKVTNDMINKARTMHNLNRSSETIIINSEIVPVVDAISDLLGIKNLRINGRQYKKLRKRKFYEDNIDRSNCKFWSYTWN